MDRRQFLKTGIVAGTALGTAKHSNDLLAMSKDNYDLVAVRGGEPDVMFDKGIAELGGMTRFVKKGQTVVVKPNIGWDVPPERAGNTNPLLVKRIIQHCFEAGAKTVYVFDNTCDNWTKCYSRSGIEKAAKDAGAKVAPGNFEKNYQSVKIKYGKNLKETKVHELILESDVFINVPILKSHSSTKLTIAMKNLMGIMWDRGWWHRNGLHQCIADFATYSKPNLNVVDCYNVLMKNGPRGVSVNDVKNMKFQIISTDIVAVDAAAAKTFGLNPDDIDYINIAAQMKVGSKNLDSMNIKRIKLD